MLVFLFSLITNNVFATASLFVQWETPHLIISLGDNFSFESTKSGEESVENVNHMKNILESYIADILKNSNTELDKKITLCYGGLTSKRPQIIDLKGLNEILSLKGNKTADYLKIYKIDEFLALSKKYPEEYFPEWAVDGSKVLFLSYHDGSAGWWEMQKEGNNQKKITLGNYLPQNWAPDRKKGIYLFPKGGLVFDGYRLVIVDFNKGAQTVLLENVSPWDAKDWRGIWSLDSSKYVYFMAVDTNNDGIIDFHDKDGGVEKRKLYVYDSKTRLTKSISDYVLDLSKGNLIDTLFSLDGSKLFISLEKVDTTTYTELYLVDLNNGKSSLIKNIEGKIKILGWSQDAKRLIFIKGNSKTIYSVDLNGSIKQELSAFEIGFIKTAISKYGENVNGSCDIDNIPDIRVLKKIVLLFSKLQKEKLIELGLLDKGMSVKEFAVNLKDLYEDSNKDKLSGLWILIEGEGKEGLDLNELIKDEKVISMTISPADNKMAYDYYQNSLRKVKVVDFDWLKVSLEPIVDSQRIEPEPIRK